MAMKFFLAELFKKNLLGGGQICPPPTKIGLKCTDMCNCSQCENESDEDDLQGGTSDLSDDDDMEMGDDDAEDSD